MDIFYRIPTPYGSDLIEVYGDRNMGWYEWRVIACDKVVRDSKDSGYGNPEIALRDALVAMSLS